ncbi:squalene/phytoene synthase family protein [Shimia sp. CNT1-13L.2]|uniref:squalene/phytoene synthase family protein n=1 Tax=Shimia sp. CNT1-13L.2 TaxID=2959663 RepID=UPI0020CD1548|nr:squalene/phytoene synthase family protein [Shimia sp. CNT1-13L.2]MCP9483075.1 squalene/phytoene synthase family protein [Shimia sp. CNT1-13L.2]
MKEEDLNACAEIVHRGDPDRFLAVMAAKPSAREVLFPIFAFNVEVARAPWVTQETMIAEMRLQWWRDALDEIAEGGAVRRHEVVTPLSEMITAEEARLLDAVVVARRWDIYRDPFEDAAHFEAFIDQTSGNLLLVAARALGEADEGVVRDFAYASGIANWLRAIPELEARGRVPLVDGRPEAVSALAKGALVRLKSARAQRGRVSRMAGQALLSGWQTAAVLKQAAAAPERVARGELAISEFARKSSLMRRALTGRW